MSLNSPSDAEDEDEQKIMLKLRESLVDGYSSVLHGLPNLPNEDQSYDFKLQIFHYLQALASCDPKEYQLNEEMVNSIVDLYCDLAYMITGNYQFTSMMPQVFELHQTVSNLANKMKIQRSSDFSQPMPQEASYLEKMSNL